MLDPRTRDAMRALPIELKKFTERLEAVEKKLDSIFKFTRSTNESVVRKYGAGKKNTATKVVEKVKEMTVGNPKE